MKTKIKNRNLPLLLSQVREVVIANFRPILHYYGLTEQQWRILRELFEEELEPKEICERCQILSPSMAGILKRLEETGLVRKKKIEGDRRRVSVSLTRKGRSLIGTMVPLVQHQYELLEEAYGKELIVQLYRALDDFMLKKGTAVRRINPAERTTG
ncbi:homoprotocatechuate degradation operon regulator HpaR [Desulfomarina sp.]